MVSTRECATYCCLTVDECRYVFGVTRGTWAPVGTNESIRSSGS